MRDKDLLEVVHSHRAQTAADRFLSKTAFVHTHTHTHTHVRRRYNINVFSHSDRRRVVLASSSPSSVDFVIAFSLKSNFQQLRPPWRHVSKIITFLSRTARVRTNVPWFSTGGKKERKSIFNLFETTRHACTCTIFLHVMCVLHGTPTRARFSWTIYRRFKINAYVIYVLFDGGRWSNERVDT